MPSARKKQLTRRLTPADLRKAEPGRYMNIHQAATHTSLTVQSLYRRVSDRSIPHVRVGRRVLFDREALEHWLEQQSVPITAAS